MEITKQLKQSKQRRWTKRAWWITGFIVVGAGVCAVPASCGALSLDVAAQQQINRNVNNQVPVNTPYQKIHNLEFSLFFTYGFGTGWMFDYAEDTKNDTITIYLATNMHVADFLRYPNDNPQYKYTQADVDKEKANSTDTASNKIDDKPIAGLTESFYLGRFDDSYGDLSSLNAQTNMSYVYFGPDALPKTQYVAHTPSTTNPEYVDFAVLSLTMKMFSSDAPKDQIEAAQRDAYEEWIKGAAIPTLNQLADPNDTKKPNYLDLFYGATGNVDANLLKDQHAFVAGYPFYDGDDYASPWFANFNPKAAIGGTPVWTINMQSDPRSPVDPTGQTFDVDNVYVDNMTIGPAIMDARNYGAFFNNSYHGQAYDMTGLDFIVNNTDLKGGSSGSVGLSANNKIFGIYWGTILNGDMTPKPIGVVAPLIVSDSLINSINNIWKTEYPQLVNLFNHSSAYDLIGGSDTGLSSYKQSLGTTKTYLFPDGVNTNNQTTTT